MKTTKTEKMKEVREYLEMIAGAIEDHLDDDPENDLTVPALISSAAELVELMMEDA